MIELTLCGRGVYPGATITEESQYSLPQTVLMANSFLIRGETLCLPLLLSTGICLA